MHTKEVVTSKDLSQFINELAKESSKTDCQWENLTLPNFLEAMAAWTAAGVEDWDAVNNIDTNTITKWQIFADILIAATMYE